jgi:uncharacterized membrane protein
MIYGRIFIVFVVVLLWLTSFFSAWEHLRNHEPYEAAHHAFLALTFHLGLILWALISLLEGRK